MKQVELLAPGGDPRAVKAAILAGADAVFLGVGDFNARKRAVNITTKDLTELCAIAHDNACRIYLTFNTLALESEFKTLVKLLHSTIEAGIDAVILQDYGLLKVIQELFPNLEIHASTQMTTHNAGQMAFLAPYNVSQVNLSRELSITEIAELIEPAHERQMMVEVFVHGAFCVSFSGQCYMSNTLYEHTANRGACVQPCRRDYTTEVGGKKLIQPMNLKDNSAFSSAKELVDMGVDSLKIEGRIKGHEYVFSTVSSWRDQVDRILRNEKSASDDARLNAVFNRQFSDYLLRGVVSRDAFTAESGDESVELVGSVWGYSADSKELAVSEGTKLFPGKKIIIRTRDDRFICTGTVGEDLGDNRFKFTIEHLLKGKILKGQKIFAQPQLTDGEKLQNLIDELKPGEQKLPLALTLTGSVGEPLRLTAAGAGKRAEAAGDIPLEAASNRPVEHATVKERLAKLGNTPFYLSSCDLSGLSEELFIPLKQLNELRREVVEQLVPEKAELPVLPEIIEGFRGKQKLAVAVRKEAQLEQLPADGSILRIFQLPADPQELERITPLFENDDTLIPWFPPILIGEQFESALRILKVRSFSMILTDNTGIAAAAKEAGIPWVAGALLNASNGYALELFREQGAVGSFLESELSSEQIRDTSIPKGIELWESLYAPVLLMNSRHCLVRNCSDCGKDEMDEWCLPNCSRKAVIYDSEKRELHVVKNRGHYNGIYDKAVRFFPERIGRGGDVLLLDFRAPYQSHLPSISLGEFTGLIQQGLSGDRGAVSKAKRKIQNLYHGKPAGLEPLLKCE